MPCFLFLSLWTSILRIGKNCLMVPYLLKIGCLNLSYDKAKFWGKLPGPCYEGETNVMWLGGCHVICVHVAAILHWLRGSIVHSCSSHMYMYTGIWYRNRICGTDMVKHPSRMGKVNISKFPKDFCISCLLTWEQHYYWLVETIFFNDNMTNA